MNHLFPKLLIPVFLIMIILSCESKKKHIDTSGNISLKVQKEVIIYGSVNCDHCNTFRKAMDDAKFKYEFKDAEASEQVYQELLRKVQEANYIGYIAFPVLDIEGELYVKPEFHTIKSLLSD